MMSVDGAPDLAADLEGVAKALRRQHADRRTLALDDGIRCDGRPVREPNHVFGPGPDESSLSGGRANESTPSEGSSRVVGTLRMIGARPGPTAHHIGERAADVDTDLCDPPGSRHATHSSLLAALTISLQTSVSCAAIE